MKNFTHLHLHTEFSLLDGLARYKKIVEVTKERGWKACAITDHGNMFGTLRFFEECVINGIKPIIGCEFYICNDRFKKIGRDDTGHLVLIAKNLKGYQNLLKLSGISYNEGFYYKPRIDYKVLEKHSEGLICLSACLAGHVPQLILKRQFDEAEKLALWHKNLFKDDYYLEIQNHDILEQKEVMIELDKLSKKLNIKLVATNDVHYVNREDADLQDALMCVQMRRYVDETDRMKFSTDEFYYKTYEEMLEKFEGFEQALDNTQEIVDKCDLVLKTKLLQEIYSVEERYKLPQDQNHIPAYDPGTGETPYEFLKRLAYEGLDKFYPARTDELIDRMESELAVIKDQGFVEYFLIVWDYINFSMKNDIPVGPGRGSGAGSLVAYCTGITRVDPIKYHLLFERFINKERVSMPDFDIDFCMDRRGEVVEYTKRKYGDEHVSNIVTYGCMKAKNSIKDIGRVLRLPIETVTKITKEIPDKVPDGLSGKKPVLKYYFGLTGDDKFEKFIIPDLRAMYENNDDIKRVVDMAVKIENAPRNTSIHAAGVIISPKEVDDYVPTAKNGEATITQYDMIECEHLGLLKMDFLGLRTLTDIDKAVKYVKEIHDIDIDFYNMEYDDPKVFELIASGQTDAIFQLESGGMKKFMKELGPTCMDDIIAGVSLYRPGPMDSIPRFVECKKNPDKIYYEDPCLEPILNMTYGCIVYQEQVMSIVQIMGGYSLGQADNIRRIMGKKQVEKIANEKIKFVDGWEDPSGKNTIPGAVKLGHDREASEKIFDAMAEFAKYAFNKSHAAAYSYVSYQTAYLKTYYEVEFLTAVLNNRISNIDDVKKYTTFAKKEGFEILSPNINKSISNFKVENGNIRFGLAGLRNVGAVAVDEIVKEREANGNFTDFENFVSRASGMALNKRCLESLIMSGAFDDFGKTRSQLMAVYPLAVEKAVKDAKVKATGQFSMFGEILKDEDKLSYPNIKEFSKEEILKKEKEFIGIYLSGHPLDNYLDKFDTFTLTSDMISTKENNEEIEEDENINDIVDEIVDKPILEDGQVVICGGMIVEKKKLVSKKTGKDMAFLKIEDLYGIIEIGVMPNVFPKFKHLIEEDSLVTIRGKMSFRGETPSVMAEDIIPWINTEPQEETIEQKLYIKCDTKNFDKFEKLKRILCEYQGSSPVIIKCESSEKAFSFSQKVKINNHLTNELYGLLGEKNIIVK